MSDQEFIVVKDEQKRDAVLRAAGLTPYGGAEVSYHIKRNFEGAATECTIRISMTPSGRGCHLEFKVADQENGFVYHWNKHMVMVCGPNEVRMKDGGWGYSAGRNSWHVHTGANDHDGKTQGACPEFIRQAKAIASILVPDVMRGWSNGHRAARRAEIKRGRAAAINESKL